MLTELLLRIIKQSPVDESEISRWWKRKEENNLGIDDTGNNTRNSLHLLRQL